MRPEARAVRGFRDLFSADVELKREMIGIVRTVYEKYGYVPLETPSIEFVDVLGKFLPEANAPDGGIFAFRNPDVTGPETGKPIDADRWLSLRYDLTAPLARVAAQYVDLAKPFRRYQVGSVWRNEKPGPGRFREFTQFDFDAVGVAHLAADAEVCAIICDALAALGFAIGDFVVRVNDRKVLQGVLETAGVENAAAMPPQALTILRAIDKLDRLGEEGVIELLGKGRKDDSGDWTAGAGLSASQIDVVLNYLRVASEDRTAVVAGLTKLVAGSTVGAEGVEELRQIDTYLTAMGYGGDRVRFDPTVIRGLEYYTGPVFEGVITRVITGDDGQPRQFGSVFGGGRYDTLIERFTGAKVPATGASIGVDRMLEAMKLLRGPRPAATAQVLVAVMSPARMEWYLQMAQQLRAGGLNAEVYWGTGGVGKQVKYADKLGIPYVLIAGDDEFARGKVQIKDLAAGRVAAQKIATNEEWRKSQPAQREVDASAAVAELLAMVKAGE